MTHQTILHGDWREYLADLKDPLDIDVMITDPPYAGHVNENATSQSAEGGARHREMGFRPMTPELRFQTCQLAARVKRWSLIYTDIESVSYWIEDLKKAGAEYVRTLPWIRWSMPQLSGDRPPQGFEVIVLAHNTKGKKTWNGPGNLTHLNHTCLRGEEKHKAEKPLDQLLDLVTWFTNPEENVIDPYSGNGTTALACKLLNRNALGIEELEYWFQRSKLRVESEDLSERDEERRVKFVLSQIEDVKERERMRTQSINQRHRNLNAQRKLMNQVVIDLDEL